MQAGQEDQGGSGRLYHSNACVQRKIISVLAPAQSPAREQIGLSVIKQRWEEKVKEIALPPGTPFLLYFMVEKPKTLIHDWRGSLLHVFVSRL